MACTYYHLLNEPDTLLAALAACGGRSAPIEGTQQAQSCPETLHAARQGFGAFAGEFRFDGSQFLGLLIGHPEPPGD